MLSGLGKDYQLPADRSYDSNALRALITDQGSYSNIRPVSYRVDPQALSPKG